MFAGAAGSDVVSKAHVFLACVSEAGHPPSDVDDHEPDYVMAWWDQSLLPLPVALRAAELVGEDIHAGTGDIHFVMFNDSPNYWAHPVVVRWSPDHRRWLPKVEA